MKMRKMMTMMLVTLFLCGCAIARAPDGTIVAAVGQGKAEHCPPDESCTKAEGGSLSDGAVDVLKTIIGVPGTIVRAAGSGLP